MLSDDRNENLESVDLATTTEFQANEAYESMSVRRLMATFGLFVAAAGLFSIVLFLLPPSTLVQSKPFDVTQNATDVVLQLSYEERRTYQPFVRLAIAHTAKKGRRSILSIKYHTEILNGLVQVSQVDKPLKSFRIDSGGSVDLLKIEDVDASKFIIRGTATLVEGSYAPLSIVWYHFNPDLVLFVIFINCVLIMGSLSMSVRISSLKNRVATIASKYEVVIMITAAILMLPLPELVYMDMLYWIRSYTWVFQVAYRSLFLVAFNTLCWNLRYRDEKDEKSMYTKSSFMLVFIAFLLTASEIATLKDKKLEANIKKYTPVAVVGLLLANIIRLPVVLGVNTEEFRGAILHLAVVIPSYVAIGLSMLFSSSRFDKLEIYTKMINVLSLMFIAFIRWPFEGAMVGTQAMQDGGDIGVEQDFVMFTEDQDETK